MVYQHANGMEEGRSAEIELKKGSSKGQSGTAGLLAGSTKRGGTASGSQQMKMAGSEAAMAGDGSGDAALLDQIRRVYLQTGMLELQRRHQRLGHVGGHQPSGDV